MAAWRIQFTLAEKLSNPERVETRRAGNGVSQQSAPGQAVSGSAGTDDSEQPQGLTGFEATLKKVDQWLGGTQ
ncbi:hypothetical protein D3C85_1831670 [compost metagenome]